MPKKSNKKMLGFYVSNKLHHAFKVKASEKGMTMSDLFSVVIEQFLKLEKKAKNDQ